MSHGNDLDPRHESPLEKTYDKDYKNDEAHGCKEAKIA